MSLITTEIRGRVGLITLNDPDKRNAITLAMNDEIGSVLDAWEADEAIGAVVLTGAGRGFCAGADLDDLMAGSNAEEMKAIYDGFLRIAHTPLPTIAAVNGAAVGAGMNMVLACDLVLAGREYAKFDSRFLQIGIHPGGGHTWRLRQITGRSTTMAMVMFNQILRVASLPSNAVNPTKASKPIKRRTVKKRAAKVVEPEPVEENNRASIADDEEFSDFSF